jgi:hypothetical protein
MVVQDAVMTAPQEQPATPSGKPLPEGFPVPQPSTAFGPDTNASAGVEMPKVNQKNPPKSTNGVFGKLGQNRKRNSGVRQLAEGDRDKIADYYTMAGMAAMMFRPRTANALLENAESCADSLMKLAKENDRVRRILVAAVEGGAWGAVAAAHGPILLSLMPEDMPERIHEMFARRQKVDVPDDLSGLDNQ